MIQSRNTCNACGVSCTQLRLKESLELWRAKYLTHRCITIAKWEKKRRETWTYTECAILYSISRALNIIRVNERGRGEGDTNAKVQRTSHSIGERGRERIYVFANDRRRRKRSRPRRERIRLPDFFFYIHVYFETHKIFSYTQRSLSCKAFTNFYK